jgi:two-component system response regulator protein GraR
MKKIIITENLKRILEQGKHLLTRAGFIFHTATSGEEVLTLHRLEKADLIIIELNMPIISGDVLCERIRQDDFLKDVSILIVHSDQNSDRQRCESCGANALLQMPVSPDILFNEVSNLLHIPKRESMRVLMKVTVKGTSNQKFFFSLSQNISSSGLLIETDSLLLKGDVITCSFFIKSFQITSQGEIVRIFKKGPTRYQYGIKFKDLNPLSKFKIEEFVRKRQEQGYIVEYTDIDNSD